MTRYRRPGIDICPDTVITTHYQRRDLFISTCIDSFEAADLFHSSVPEGMASAWFLYAPCLSLCLCLCLSVCLSLWLFKTKMILVCICLLVCLFSLLFFFCFSFFVFCCCCLFFLFCLPVCVCVCVCVCVWVCVCVCVCVCVLGFWMGLWPKYNRPSEVWSLNLLFLLFPLSLLKKMEEGEGVMGWYFTGRILGDSISKTDSFVFDRKNKIEGQWGEGWMTAWMSSSSHLNMSFRAVGLACEAFCAGARLTRIFAIFIFHLLVLSFFYSFLSSFLPSFLPSILCFFFLSFFLSVPLSSVIDSLILPFFHLLSRFFFPDVSSSPSLIVRSSNENHYMLHFVMHTWWIQNSIKKIKAIPEKVRFVALKSSHVTKRLVIMAWPSFISMVCRFWWNCCGSVPLHISDETGIQKISSW